MNKEVHRADSRGLADHGWLYSRHSFSFARYQNPQRMGWGKLRVLNDDIIQPGQGFGTHPHDNMEIVSIPLSGALRHQDSMGHEYIIQAGEVQIMSAGTGISHSEYNPSDSQAAHLLQIWVLPHQFNMTPRYQQRAFDTAQRLNRFQLLVSPQHTEHTLWINQTAYFSLAHMDAGHSLSYRCYTSAPALYLFVIEGEIQVASERLRRRDALALTACTEITIKADEAAEILGIETMSR